jgi:hypothetical protein
MIPIPRSLTPASFFAKTGKMPLRPTVVEISNVFSTMNHTNGRSRPTARYPSRSAAVEESSCCHAGEGRRETIAAKSRKMPAPRANRTVKVDGSPALAIRPPTRPPRPMPRSAVKSCR